MPIQRCHLPYSESAVRDLRERLDRTRWPDTIPGSSWEYGFDLEYLQSICRYWRETFDWKADLGRLARLHHREYITGDQSIHFVHESGSGPSPMKPLRRSRPMDARNYTKPLDVSRRGRDGRLAQRAGFVARARGPLRRGAPGPFRRRLELARVAVLASRSAARSMAA